MDGRVLAKQFEKIKSEIGVDDPWLENAGLLMVGVLHDDAFQTAPINTLDNALIEISAGRFWILKDLRRERPADSLNNGFLSNQNYIDFNKLLLNKVDPLFGKQLNERFIRLLEADLQRRNVTSKKK